MEAPEIYFYGRKTLEFLGVGKADTNPAVDDGWLIPACATRTPPPLPIPENKAAAYDATDDSWLLVDDYRGIEYWLADRSHYKIDALGEKPPADALFEEPSEPEKPVAERKADLCKKIDLAADEARKRFVSPGDLIEKEYEVALQQAKDWLDAGMPDPVPSAVQSGMAASNNTLTAEQAAQQILDMAAAWEGVLMATREVRLTGKAAVNAAADDADFDAVAQPFLGQLEAIKPGVV